MDIDRLGITRLDKNSVNVAKAWRGVRRIIWGESLVAAAFAANTLAVILGLMMSGVNMNAWTFVTADSASDFLFTLGSLGTLVAVILTLSGLLGLRSLSKDVLSFAPIWKLAMLYTVGGYAIFFAASLLDNSGTILPTALTVARFVCEFRGICLVTRMVLSMSIRLSIVSDTVEEGNTLAAAHKRIRVLYIAAAVLTAAAAILEKTGQVSAAWIFSILTGLPCAAIAILYVLSLRRYVTQNSEAA